jgi:hypothetical protein
VLDVEPLLSLDVGGAPDPDGGVPLGAPELLLPILGQFLVEPECALDPELAPELPLLELEEGVVLEEPELVPELPDVVAALATSAPPVRRPVVSAPTAMTLRKRMCMAVVSFHVAAAPARCEPVLHTVRPGSERSRRATWTAAASRATNA